MGENVNGNAPIEHPQIDQFAAEMDDFADVIRTDKTSIVSGEEGLRDMLVMDAIYKSAATGRKQRVQRK